MSRMKVLSLLLVVVFLVSMVACGATEAPAPTEKVEAPTAEQVVEAPTEKPVEPQVTQSDLVIGMAVHAPPAEALFWGVVEKGAKDAAAALGVTLKSGGSRDPTEQAAPGRTGSWSPWPILTR
jgi:ABC-type sugar transport system substrate-binding protein